MITKPEVKNGPPLGQGLSRSKTIYIFRCGTTALLALTTDRTGRVLPRQFAGDAGWNFERSVTLQAEEGDRRYEAIRATLAAVTTHGFYLTHAAMHSTPVDDIGGLRDQSELMS